MRPKAPRDEEYDEERKLQMKVVKRILLVLLCLVLALVLLVGTVIALNAPANTKAMKRSVEVFLDTVQQYYPVKEVDCGDYSNLKLYGIMKFDVKQYEVEGVGNLAVMTTNVGVMQMATVVLTPTQRDLPLISMDYMYILGNRTAYLEVYDLVLDAGDAYQGLLQDLAAVRSSYDALETVTPSAAWYDSLKTEGFYKKGTKADDQALLDMLEKGLQPVMAYGQSLPELEPEARAEKAALQKTYSTGLIENGGISTDIFVKAMGAEATQAFFDKLLFKVD